jgi:hypothetical protein
MPLTNINAAKEAAATYKPLLLATVTFSDGTVLRLSTDPLNTSEGGVQYGGADYLGRIRDQSIDQIQAIAETGIDLIPSVSLSLADPDAYLLTNYERAHGFRGASLELRFVFYDVAAGAFSSDSRVVFVGTCDEPATTDQELTVSASSKTQLSRAFFPIIPCQRRCPYTNPTTAAQRTAAASADSVFYQCGETRSLAAAPPCSYTKDTCTQPTNFGGSTWAPAATGSGREYVSGQNVSWKNNLNEARYGTYFPLVYGTAWVDALVMPVFGDANYTRAECVVASGEISNVLKFVVNGVEVSPTNDRDGNAYAYANKDYRYTWINNGKRSGAPCMDVPYSGNGDPYGGLAAFLFVVPKAVADPASVPSVRVLVQGPKVRKYLKITSVSGSGGVLTVTVSGANQDVNDGTTVTITGNSLGSGTWPAINGTWGPPGTFQLQGSSGSGTVAGGYVAYDSYSENPVWCLMNMLIRTNFSYSDLDLDSFIDAAAYCDQTVSYTDESNNTSTRKRFSYSTFMRERRSAADVIRGLRQSAGLMLIPSSATGKLQVIAKQTLAGQQPSAVDGSNYNSPISSVLANGTTESGYSAYHFDSAAILKRDRPTTLKTIARPVSETPNRIAFNFADRAYTFAQSSISMVDSEDVARIGREIAGGGSAVAPEGITYYDQAYRQGKTLQAETHRGNAAGTTQGTIWAELETSFRAVHLRVGHIVHVTSARYNWSLQPFRVMKIQPARNYQTVRLTLAWHADAWYTDAYATAPGPDATNNGRAIAALRPPFVWNPAKVNPVSGDPYFAATEKTFGIVQNYEDTGDGKLCRLDLSGLIPINQVSVSVAPPLVPLQATVSASGGALPGQRSCFLAIAAKDSSGSLSALSELVRADLSASGSTFTATINSPAWQAGTSGWALFAGVSPQRLTLQAEGSGTPSSVTLSTLLASDAPAPDLAFDHLEVDLARVAFSGHVLAQVAGVGANTLTLAGVSMTTNYWSGYEVSLLASAASASIPVRNYSISSNTGTVLTLGSNPVGSVSVGDWVAIRAKPSVSGLVFTDAKAAWTANEHAGRVLRIIAGAARGQVRKIASNTSTTITVDADFATAPDSTSRFIIEEPTVQTLATPPQTNSSRTAEITLSLEVANYLGRVLRITAFTADGNGRRGAETEAPTREVYVTGVRVSTSATKTPFDYGAVGDGTTNDTAAVQDCADANDVWQIPQGYTFLTDGVTLTDRTGIRITGGGTLKQRVTTETLPVCLTLDGCSDVTLAEFRIDGNKAALTASNAHGLMLYECAGRIAVDGVQIADAKGNGLIAYADADTTMALLTLRGLTVSGCTAAGVRLADDAHQVITSAEIRDCKISDCSPLWTIGAGVAAYTAYGNTGLLDRRIANYAPAAPPSINSWLVQNGSFTCGATFTLPDPVYPAFVWEVGLAYYAASTGGDPLYPIQSVYSAPIFSTAGEDGIVWQGGPYPGAEHVWASICARYGNADGEWGPWAISSRHEVLLDPAYGLNSLDVKLVGTPAKDWSDYPTTGLVNVTQQYLPVSSGPPDAVVVVTKTVDAYLEIGGGPVPQSQSFPYTGSGLTVPDVYGSVTVGVRPVASRQYYLHIHNGEPKVPYAAHDSGGTNYVNFTFSSEELAEHAGEAPDEPPVQPTTSDYTLGSIEYNASPELGQAWRVSSFNLSAAPDGTPWRLYYCIGEPTGPTSWIPDMEGVGPDSAKAGNWRSLLPSTGFDGYYHWAWSKDGVAMPWPDETSAKKPFTVAAWGKPGAYTGTTPAATVSSIGYSAGKPYIEFAITFTRPSPDPFYHHTQVERQYYTNSSRTTILNDLSGRPLSYANGGADTTVTSPYLRPRMDLWAAAQYMKYRITPVDFFGVPNYAASVEMDVTFPAAPSGANVDASKIPLGSGMEVSGGNLQPKLDPILLEFNVDGALTAKSLALVQGVVDSVFTTASGKITLSSSNSFFRDVLGASLGVFDQIEVGSGVNGRVSIGSGSVTITKGGASITLSGSYVTITAGGVSATIDSNGINCSRVEATTDLVCGNFQAGGGAVLIGSPYSATIEANNSGATLRGTYSLNSAAKSSFLSELGLSGGVASSSFTTADGKTVTVTNGIITSVA